VNDNWRIEGGWRENPSSGGAQLAAATALAALPVEMASIGFRMADAGLTATARIFEAAIPGAKPGPGLEVGYTLSWWARSQLRGCVSPLPGEARPVTSRSATAPAAKA
jgi:hypothetical protein